MWVCQEKAQVVFMEDEPKKLLASSEGRVLRDQCSPPPCTSKGKAWGVEQEGEPAGDHFALILTDCVHLYSPTWKLLDPLSFTLQ